VGEIDVKSVTVRLVMHMWRVPWELGYTRMCVLGAGQSTVYSGVQYAAIGKGAG
jgi:hypothetical protein